MLLFTQIFPWYSFWVYYYSILNRSSRNCPQYVMIGRFVWQAYTTTISASACANLSTYRQQFQFTLHKTSGQIQELPFEKLWSFFIKKLSFWSELSHVIHLTTQESKSHGNLLLVHLLEKEKKSLELVISSQQAQEHALKTHIQHLQDELENQDSMVCSFFPSIRSDVVIWKHLVILVLAM